MRFKGSSRLFFLLTICLATGFAPKVHARRGDLLKIHKIESLKAADLKKGRSQFFPKMNIPDPRNGLVVYKVDYETVALDGLTTTASGAVFLPDPKGVTSGQSFPLLAYEHGTALNRDNVPSRANIESAAVAVSFGSLGYVIAAPDYLGGGDNVATHPYHHAASEASASIDMLRASRALAQQLGIVLNDQLFLTGYSQGGHAAMALHKELEENPTDEFTVTASAPMSGAYDLSHTTLKSVIADPTKNSVIEVSFILLSMNMVYHLYPSLDQVIDPKYAAILPGLFDGTHDWEDIAGQLPATPREIGTPDFVNDLASNPNNLLVLALEKNDVYNWKPVAPVQMTYSAGDHDVAPGNSLLAYKTMKNLGAPVELVKVSDTLSHVGALGPSFEAQILWLETMRAP